MAGVVSAIGEATGLKPDDKSIGLTMIDAAKAKAQAYLAATLGATSPDVRHVFQTHLQDALTEHEHMTKLAIQRGWVMPNLPSDQMVQSAASDAQAVMQ